MKFTKEQAYEELVKRMTSKGEKLNLSSRTMNADLETLIPVLVNDETELTDFVDKVMPIFQNADANVRNDVSQGIRDYKEKNPVTTPSVPPVNESHDTELENRLKVLEEALQKSQLENKTRDAKSNLKRALKEKGVKNDAWIDVMLTKVSVGDDFDVEAEATSYLDMYNKMMASYDPHATPNNPTSGTDTYISDSIKAAGELVKAQSLVE